MTIEVFFFVIYEVDCNSGTEGNSGSEGNSGGSRVFNGVCDVTLPDTETKSCRGVFKPKQPSQNGG